MHPCIERPAIADFGTAPAVCGAAASTALTTRRGRVEYSNEMLHVWLVIRPAKKREHAAKGPDRGDPRWEIG
jgi:hypothetical protein